MSNLDDVLFDDTDDIHDASNGDIDDILNESDDSIKELNIEKANLILSEKKLEKQQSLFQPKEEYEILIRKYIEHDFASQQQESSNQIVEFSDDELQIQEPQSLLDKIDESERAMKKVQLEHINLMEYELKISNLEIHNLQAISNQLKALQGKPCIIKCENDIVSIGTSAGEILVYVVTHTEQFGILRYKSKVSDMDNNSALLVAGYEDKKIILWDPNSKAQLKMLEHQQPLLAIKFVSDYRFLISDYIGCTFSCKINKLLWSYSLDVDKLLARNIQPFYQIAMFQQFIAFVCLEQVLVVKLDPQPQIHKRISRQMDDFTYPSVCWGQITNTEGYTEMIDIALCVSWGTHIEIYIMDNNGAKQKFSYLFNNNNIISCSWVSRDMILLVDKQFNLITLNAQFFNQDSITEEMRNMLKKYPNYIQNKSDKAIQSIIPLGDVINHALQINNGKQQISIYNNCIHQYNRFTYLLTQPIIKRVKVMMWSDYMKKLIENADSQESWYEILTFGLKLYWNQIHCFALPQNSYDQRIVIADISKDICSAFINLVGQKIEQQKASEQQKYEEWNKAIISAIQYCIECNQQQFLFSGLKSLITKFHKYTQFLTNLEHFILSNSIKQIPTEILLHLSTHYKVMQKPDIVQQLILSLDPKFLEMTTIFQICQDNDLYTPLIVVCPRIDHDYITPLQKMYSNFLKTQNTSMLLKSLWFINLTFKQTLFPNSKIPDDIYKQAFSQIIMWLLLEDIFRNFAIHYPQELFETLKLAINTNNALQFNQEIILKYFNFQKPILVAFIHKIYQSLNQTMVTYEQIGIHFSKFIGQVRGLALDEDVYLRALKYLIKDKNNFKYILNIIDQFDIKIQQKNDLFQQADDNYIKSLFASDVFKSMELCLQNVNKNNFILLFSKLITQKREIMLNVLNFYFERLVDDYFELSKELLCILTPQEQLKIMNRQQICENYMELFHSLNPQNKELRFLYIKQCCLYCPNYVLDKISHFGLDDLEQIFLETKHKEGLGYIYARVGKFEMAMKFFIQSLLEYLEQCFKQNKFNQELLNLKFELLFDACNDSLKHDDKNIYLQMGQLLFNKETSLIWKLSEQVNENNYSFIIPMLQLINNRLCEYYNKLKIDQLIILVEQQKEIFDMLWIKWSFKNLIESYRLQYRFWDRCHEIELQNYLYQKWSIFNENASSPEYDNLCSLCTQQIIEPQQHVLIRRCGHSTHQSCLQQPFCQLCNPKIKMQLELVLANNKQFDELDQKRREILIKENEQVKIHRKLEEIVDELELTQEDIKIHEENRIMHDLELFDNFFNS